MTISGVAISCALPEVLWPCPLLERYGTLKKLLVLLIAAAFVSVFVVPGMAHNTPPRLTTVQKAENPVPLATQLLGAMNVKTVTQFKGDGTIRLANGVIVIDAEGMDDGGFAMLVGLDGLWLVEREGLLVLEKEPDVGVLQGFRTPDEETGEVVAVEHSENIVLRLNDATGETMAVDLSGQITLTYDEQGGLIDLSMRSAANSFAVQLQVIETLDLPDEDDSESERMIIAVPISTCSCHYKGPPRECSAAASCPAGYYAFCRCSSSGCTGTCKRMKAHVDILLD